MSKKVLLIEEKDLLELREILTTVCFSTDREILDKLEKSTLPDAVVFEAELEEDTRSGATTCDTEKCIYLPDQLQESDDFKLKDPLLVIVAKLPEKGGRHGYDIKAQSESM